MSYFVIAWVCLLAFFVVVILEMFIPTAGLLMVISLLLALAAVVAGFMHSLLLGALMVAILVLSIPALLAMFSYVWPHTPIGRRLIMSAPDPASIMPEPTRNHRLEDLIGAAGEVLSPMLPTGSIQIQGKSYVATCESGAAEPGQKVRVSRLQMNRIFVVPVEIADDLHAPGGFNEQLENAVESEGHLDFNEFEWEPDPPQKP